jgi:ribosomal subunit interface protein
MKFNTKFRNMKRSEELAQFLEDRFSKLHKFETKPLTVTATFSVERHLCKITIHANGPDMQMKATASETNFYDAIETVLHRCIRQMSRKKAKLQNHKCYERTKESRLDHLAAEEEAA